ncbi:PEP-CTERM/exosortase system-associated acyltransferase [Vreelandella sp. EE22]
MSENLAASLEKLASSRSAPFDAEVFAQRFELIIAHTDEERLRAFALRHRVFREELQYQIGGDQAFIEHDEYDVTSILCLLRHRESGLDAGCLRVVLVPDTLKGLPFEGYYDAALLTRTTPRSFERGDICEVSRLAVHPEFRRKSTDTARPGWLHENPAMISLSLFLAATALVGVARTPHVFAVLEPKFNRMLGAAGLRFEQIGEAIDYCGKRAPYYIHQPTAERHLPASVRPLYELIQATLTKSFEHTS